MTDADKLILTLYLIIVIWVLYQAIKSLGELIGVKFDKEAVTAQLEQQDLKDKIEVKFNLKARYKVDEFKQLEIEIKNNLPQQSISIDWDSSCLIDAKQKTQRLIRLSPSMKVDIFVAQVNTIVAPTKTLGEKFTIERALKLNTNTGGFEPSEPLVNSSQLKSKPINETAATLVVRLALQLSPLDSQGSFRRNFTLSCPLNVIRLNWTSALPWLSPKS